MSNSHNRKKTEVRIEFGKRLRCKRQERGFTLEVLAEKADLATSYIASVERGERNLGLENIVALAAAMDISPSDLLPGVQHRKKEQVKVEFGKRLKSKREERGFTLESLAEQAGLDPLAIAFLEQGEGNMGFDTIIALAQALEVSLKELMPDSESS